MAGPLAYLAQPGTPETPARSDCPQDNWNQASKSSHSLPSRGSWEDTLQEVPDFIGSDEQKSRSVRFTPESGHVQCMPIAKSRIYEGQRSKGRP